jgi:Peptidase family M28
MHSSNRLNRRARIVAVLVLVFASSCSAVQTPPGGVQLTDDMRTAINAISAVSLRDHLKFIASDELQGRNTPSPELDRAADYIAASFKKAGLEAVGDDGYFQTAKWVQMVRNPKTFSMSIQSGSDTVNFQSTQVGFAFPDALSLSKVPLVKIDFNNTTAQAELKQSDLEGKAVITELPDIQRADRARRGELVQAQRTFTTLMQSLKVVAIASIDRNGTGGTGFNPGRLIDPENRPPQITAQTQSLPIVQLVGPDAIKAFDGLPIGATNATESINVDAPAEVPVKIRNVIGVLRGSDQVLRDTYVMVTAHYDHLGMNPNVAGPDKIFNGANDDGSGTVSVMELAAALSKLKSKPKRSIVFMTVFGEEKGLLGSRYYGRHPIFPIEKTVADVNLEQIGRTDDSEGPQVNTCAMTGFDFSNMGAIFKAAGASVGINVYKHPTNSDAYFSRSDNQALADQGVPAHTLSVAYEYPDYHKVGDHWDKIDYDNMAKVDQMVAVGLLMIANNPAEPKWNEANPKTARYVKAWQDHHPK